MKKFAFLTAFALSAVGALAEAQFAQPVPFGSPGWCYIQAHLRVRSGAFLIGGAHGRGYGRIVCEYADNSAEVMPILIETSALGLGFELPEEFDAKMFTSGLIGASDQGAAGFLGTYLTSRLKLGVGPLNGEFGLNADLDGFSIPLTVQLDADFQAIAATLKFGHMTVRFDPRNMQARHHREWCSRFPAPLLPRGYRHHHAGRCHQPAHPAPRPRRPLPAPRPAPAPNPAPAPGSGGAPPPPTPPNPSGNDGAPAPSGSVQGELGQPDAPTSGDDGSSDPASDDGLIGA